MAAARKQDLLIVIDATASMGSYLNALRQSLPEILALSRLSGAFDRIGVLAYRDYCDSDLIEWSGWNGPDLTAFVSRLSPSGGGDMPEAAKTALLTAFERCDDRERHTLVLWYADAPPHSASSHSSNANRERRAYPAGATDWVKLVFQANKRHFSVFAFVEGRYIDKDILFYALLAEATGGRCVLSSTSESTSISRLTLDVVIQWTALYDWTGTEQQESRENFGAHITRYAVPPQEASPKPMSEEAHAGYLATSTNVQIFTEPLDVVSNIPHGPTATTATRSLSRRFADPAEGAYRRTVHATLGALIASNVYALTYNPVFGQLWRAVCKRVSDDETESVEKQALVNAFSQQVGAIADPSRKAGMQQWLEDSFDATEEIEALIANVDLSTNPEKRHVYLDLDSGVEMTRKELLEVSHSCYAGVLKRLATVFTHLKVVEELSILAPAQRTLPLALPPTRLFQLLPHLVVPGTLFSKRAAALTATLALITGVSFLLTPARTLLESVKGTWLDLAVPENISFDCARFLLEAPAGVVLTEGEKKVYEGMKRYRGLEMGLEAAMDVKVGWTPDRTRGVGDQKVRCVKCGIRRSVTIMSHERDGICGLCAFFETGDYNATPQEYTEVDEMESCWVECSVRTCRAQYIVEDLAKLRVKPKCHYCRTQVPCPFLECSRCANRVVVPSFYRDDSISTSSYLCPGCTNPARVASTICTTESSARELVAENGVTWLGLRSHTGVLQGKSAFKLAQAHGLEVFLPAESAVGTSLETLGGKKIHNAEEVRLQVERRAGRGEAEMGCCPLCFCDMPQRKLVPTCGRRGCKYRVDEACLTQWYGANKPGTLLNVMQTMCPFCRRIPATKVLARYNRGVATLGGLRAAADDRAWFYAWCAECGFARRAYERRCCEGERALDALEGFVCEECVGRRAGAGASSTKSVADMRITACPKCGVMVEKESGCNHITCPCGQHFCHVCGEGTDESRIYEHLSEAHGSIYDSDGDYSDYEYEG